MTAPAVPNRPRLLDLFSGAGGAAMGYTRAGFEVVGVDIEPQPHYPFEFHQADAMTYPLDGFDIIHASPPCQHFTRYRNNVKDITDRYDDLLEPTRRRLLEHGTPFVIENVPGAPMTAHLQLCGSMFGLDVRRHRWFEVHGPGMILTPPCNHGIWTRRKYKQASNRDRGRFTIEVGAWDEPLEVQRRCMGVDWPMTLRELSEAIPPAYTEWIGARLMEALDD